MSQTKNPFGEPDEGSPLSGSAAAKKPKYSDDYNPFAEKPVNQTTSNAFSKAAVLPPPPPQPSSTIFAPAPSPYVPPSLAPPPYTPPPAQSAPKDNSANEFIQRQQELDRRAAELAAREKQLPKQSADSRANNWPPLPKCCPKPCFYQNFEVDIVPPHRRIVKIMYYLWIAYSLALVVNVVFCMAYFISASELTDGSGSAAGVTFGFSLLWLVLFVPLAFLCWYRPIYKAFRSNSSISFFAFFFVFFSHIITSIVMALGVGSTGFVGWIAAFTMLGMPGSQKIVGGAMTIMAIIFTINAAVCIALFVRIVRTYRSTGASFKQAQKDFAQGVLKSQTSAAASTVAANPSVPANAAAGQTSAPSWPNA